MFGPAGFAYVYFTYGMHWMLNIVTGQVGRPNAVLLRALEPVEGEDLMAQRRAPRPRKLWTNGPGKLAQALDIDKRLNGHNLFAGNGLLWVEADLQVSSSQVCSGPRVGLGKTPEPWFSKPWRYWIDDNPYVSGYR
jgi:DNA-3-methyladenine glycosylase